MIKFLRKNKYYVGAISLLIVMLVGFFIKREQLLHQKVIQTSKIIDEPVEDTLQAIVLPDSIHIPIPAQLDFCGEPVPLDREDVRESLDYELIVNSFRHSRTIWLIKRQNRWKPMITRILKEENVPEDFFYLAVAESELLNNALSHSGASGMWQFMERTGKEYGLKQTNYIDQRRDPEMATRAACKYFKRGYDKFGSWTAVAASYNMGMSGLQRRMNEQKEDDYYDLFLNTETSRYVFRILAFKQILEHPDQYGFRLSKESLYDEISFDEVTVEKTTDLIEFAQKHNMSYKQLRRLNPWLNNSMRPKLPVRRNESYMLRVAKK